MDPKSSSPDADVPLNVLVLSQHYWPESFRINEVVDSLRECGCNVSVLTGKPNYPDGVIFGGYRAGGWGKEAHPNGYTIFRVPLKPRGRGTALQLVGNYLSFVVTASLLGPWLLRGQRIDVVFVYGTSPILQAIAAIAIARFKRAALVTWVQDLWPQSLEVTGYVRNPRLLALVAGLVRWIYRRCDLLLVQSPAFVPTVRAMAGRVPVEVHPNPGEAAFERAPDSRPPAVQLEPGFNVVFAGNLGTAQALDTVLDAAKQLQAQSEIRFVLVGSGSRAEWLRDQVQARGLRNVCLAGRFAPASMPGILTQASALLVTLVRSPIMSQTVPSKVQAYLAAGRPLIASLDGEGARVVSEAGAGFACPAEDPAALAAAVLRLFALPAAERQRLGDSGMAYYRAHFQPHVLASRLSQRLSNLVQSRHGRCPAAAAAGDANGATGRAIAPTTSPEAMQRTLSPGQIEAFYHDDFVTSQVEHFRQLARPAAGRMIVDVGGGCGFFAEGLARLTGWPVRVIDTDALSVATCIRKGVAAVVDDALAPRIRGDEDVVCFNLILHHLVGANEASTIELQRQALRAWHGSARAVFVNEYIYDSYVAALSGRLIYEITSSRLLSALASAISRWVPSLRANTFGVGVRFRAHDEWVRIFESLGFKVTGVVRGAEEDVSAARRMLLIRSCRRDSFLLEPAIVSR